AFDSALDGAAIAEAEVERILLGAATLAEAENAFYSRDGDARQLTRAIETAEAQFYGDEAWQRLARDFALSQCELDLLTLIIAAEIEPALRRVYGYLNDDVTACRATPHLASCLFEWPSAPLLTPQSPIVAWRLAQPAEDAPALWSATSPWRVDPFLVGWIAEGRVLDPFLGDGIFAQNDRGLPPLCLYPAELSAMQSFVEALNCRLEPFPEGARPRLEIEVIGDEGSGKRTLVAQLCKALGRRLVVADADLFCADVPLVQAQELVVRAMRTARLSGAVLLWRRAERMSEQLFAHWPRRYAADMTFFSACRPLRMRHGGGTMRRSFTLPPLQRAQRIAVWTQHTAASVDAQAADLLLSPAEIAEAARMAPAGAEAVAQAVRDALRCGTSELFAPLPCPYSWDDLVVAASVRRHLSELQAQAQLRWRVYEDWGFRKLSPLGKSVTAMFAGPSGTGKTMAAQVLAATLGMELYRIDLAEVVNKYIGETEKRLRKIFEVCERANVLLFFDEADALFGQRTRVKDAHDRYANIEIDYLLQRMEQFDGVAILATNRKNDIDQAFLRRIRFIVDFLPPGPEERLELWRRSLLAATPDGDPLLESVDWNFLANKLPMTGADIKGAALGAAFLACAEGTRIGMRHVLYAARRELNKRGAAAPACEWRG
ncbi:MAG TPA: ATP-binding protein, partial [Methylocystis sp.]|nr:ATP-binding protein [Methylocystis sp.]